VAGVFSDIDIDGLDGLMSSTICTEFSFDRGLERHEWRSSGQDFVGGGGDGCRYRKASGFAVDEVVHLYSLSSLIVMSE
jgi:hypothetical protein